MAFDENLADRIREALVDTKNVTEKEMFGGIAFMVKDKMCVGVFKNDLIVRCGPAQYEELLSREGAKPFDITGKPMKGWLLVEQSGIKSKHDFDHWINLALENNKALAPAKRRKKS
jgi:TfoX/Sxy family transcriptional regulator of competence genes